MFPIAPGGLPAGQPCTLCGETAVVHWLRRLTPDEVAQEQAIEQGRRDNVMLLADPQLPAPTFGPLPDCADCVHTVWACGEHAIEADAAALVHQGDCTAPNADDLPGCGCTPEPAPEQPPVPEPAPLPAGW